MPRRWYRTGSLLDYLYFKENYDIIAIDLCKAQVPDANPKAMQQINCIENIETKFIEYRKQNFWMCF